MAFPYAHQYQSTFQPMMAPSNVVTMPTTSTNALPLFQPTAGHSGQPYYAMAMPSPQSSIVYLSHQYAYMAPQTLQYATMPLAYPSTGAFQAASTTSSTLQPLFANGSNMQFIETLPQYVPQMQNSGPVPQLISAPLPTAYPNPISLSGPQSHAVTAATQAIANGEDVCNLYVSSLPNSFSTKQLIDLFSPFGPIASARFSAPKGAPSREADASLSQSELSRGYGFVCFHEAQHAATAMASMIGAVINGSRLQVRPSRKRGSKDNRRTSGGFEEPQLHDEEIGVRSPAHLQQDCTTELNSAVAVNAANTKHEGHRLSSETHLQQ